MGTESGANAMLHKFQSHKLLFHKEHTCTIYDTLTCNNALAGYPVVIIG